MEISRELLFFFSALGAFNGLILGLYFFFFSKPKHISNYFLGTLLIALSIRIGKSVFYYFNPDLSEIFLQIGLSACAFIGPSLYFYLKSISRTGQINNGSWKYHFVIIGSILLIVGYIYPWYLYPDMWYYFFNIIYFEWLVYLVASGLVLQKLFKKYLWKEDRLTSIEIWILSVFIGNALIWIVYNVVDYRSYIVGALSFTFILYLLVLQLLFNKKKDYILFKKQGKYGDKKIDELEAGELTKKLRQVMIEQKLYKDPNLKLPEVAKKLNMLPHRLSQLINDNLSTSFSSFVNEYRINEAKKLLKSNDKFSLEAIGYECGFNSKSTFYSTFNKFTRTTPAKFQSELLNQVS